MVIVSHAERGHRPNITPYIYGIPLDWHAARRELENKHLPPCDRRSSIFRQQEGSLRREITIDKATDTEVFLSANNNFIYFIARIIPIPEGFTMMTYDVQLKYPPEASPSIVGRRFKGMPYFHELTPGVKAYFESLGHRIDGIRSEWRIETSNYRSDNYRKYMQAKGDGPHSPILARTGTPAGENATRLGFTGKVRVRDGQIGSKKEPGIIVDYFRPGIIVPQAA